MAIRKSIELERTGATAVYWRLARAHFRADGSADYVLAGYVNKAAATAGKDPIIEQTYEIADGRNAALSRADMYTDAKTRPEFAGATDD